MSKSLLQVIANPLGFVKRGWLRARPMRTCFGTNHISGHLPPSQTEAGCQCISTSCSIRRPRSKPGDSVSDFIVWNSIDNLMERSVIGSSVWWKPSGHQRDECGNGEQGAPRFRWTIFFSILPLYVRLVIGDNFYFLFWCLSFYFYVYVPNFLCFSYFLSSNKALVVTSVDNPIWRTRFNPHSNHRGNVAPIDFHITFGRWGFQPLTSQTLISRTWFDRFQVLSWVLSQNLDIVSAIFKAPWWPCAVLYIFVQ